MNISLSGSSQCGLLPRKQIDAQQPAAHRKLAWQWCTSGGCVREWVSRRGRQRDRSRNEFSSPPQLQTPIYKERRGERDRRSRGKRK